MWTDDVRLRIYLIAHIADRIREGLDGEDRAHRDLHTAAGDEAEDLLEGTRAHARAYQTHVHLPSDIVAGAERVTVDLDDEDGGRDVLQQPAA